jgi:molybdopterin-binding protein
MSHHYSGPNIGFPRGDARLDLTDLYAFPKPGDAGRSIFIMNVHPSVGLNPPGSTTAERFAPEASLPGTIQKIVSDKVMSEVVIRTEAGVVTSIITTGSVERMNLKEGDRVFAVIKATSVSIKKG